MNEPQSEEVLAQIQNCINDQLCVRPEDKEISAINSESNNVHFAEINNPSFISSKRPGTTFSSRMTEQYKYRSDHHKVQKCACDNGPLFVCCESIYCLVCALKFHQDHKDIHPYISQ